MLADVAGRPASPYIPVQIEYVHEAGKAVCQRLPRYSAAIDTAEPLRTWSVATVLLIVTQHRQPGKGNGLLFILLRLPNASVHDLTPVCRNASHSLTWQTALSSC